MTVIKLWNSKIPPQREDTDLHKQTKSNGKVVASNHMPKYTLNTFLDALDIITFLRQWLRLVNFW